MWSNGANWSNGVEPDGSTDVTIPSSAVNQPIIGADAVCRNIAIQAGASLTISGSSILTVSGNWLNSGSFIPNTSTVVFNGGAPTVSGGTTFTNLTIHTSAGITFGNQGITTINGIYTIENAPAVNVYNGSFQYGPNGGLKYNNSNPMTASSEWPGTFVGLGGVTIEGTGVITLNGPRVFGNSTQVPLIISAGATLETGNNQLTFHGDFTNKGILQAGTSFITLAGTLGQSIDSLSTTGDLVMNKTAGTATLTGNIHATGLTINGSGGTLNAGSILLNHTFTGTWKSMAGTLDGGSSTINFTASTVLAYTGGAFVSDAGTVGYSALGNQTVDNIFSYYNLLLSGSGIKTFRGSTTIVNDLTILTPVTADLGSSYHTAFTLHLDTTPYTSGSFGAPFSGATIDNTGYFGTTSTGILSLGTSACIPGSWTGATNTDWNTVTNWCGDVLPGKTSNVLIPAGLTNYPVITAADTCNNITISTGASLTISGSGTLAVYGNWTNNGGTFTPGTGTVRLSGGASTLSGATSFSNLTLAGTGTVTMAGGITVNGILSMENGTNTVVMSGSGLLTYGPASTLQYNAGASVRTVSVEWPTVFPGSGGVKIISSGTITLNAGKQFGDATHANVDLNIVSGTLSTSSSNYGLTFYHNFTNTGTLSAGASPITMAGTEVQTIAGIITTGAVSMTKTGGTATFAGNVNGGAFTLTGLGGSLNLGAGLRHTFTGVWTRTNGTLLGNTSTLLIGGTTTGTTGTFTAGTSKVIYNSVNAQTIANVTFYNLTLSGAGVKTFVGF